MKKLMTTGIIALSIGAFSFTILIDKVAATANVEKGLSVFAFSKPVSKYDILGMVKVKGMVKSEKGPHMVNLLIESAKKEYPSAEGIIVGSTFENAEVIRFKD